MDTRRHSRDTIQEYIDLWEQLPAADRKDSIPPTPPPKDGFDYLKAIDDLRRHARDKPPPSPIPIRTGDRSVKLTPKLAQGGKIMSTEHLWLELEVEDLKTPQGPPPVLEQLQTAFLGMHKAPVEQTPTDTSSEYDSKFSPDTPSDYAHSYVAVVESNPFGSYESLPIPVDSEPDLKPQTSLSPAAAIESRLTSPFSPEDIWMHHVPEGAATPLITPQEELGRIVLETAQERSRTPQLQERAATPPRLSAVGGNVPKTQRSKLERASRSRGGTMKSRPLSIDTKSARTESVQSALASASSISSTPFTTYEEYYPLTPRPYSPAPKIPPKSKSRRESLRVSPKTTSRHSSSGASTSSGDSIAEEGGISEKAAKMLGIETQRTFPAFDPDRARRTSLSHNPSLSTRRSSISAPSGHYPVPKGYIVSPISSRRSTDLDSVHVHRHKRFGSDTTWTTNPGTPGGWARMPYDAQLDAACVWKALKKTKKADTDLLSATLVSVSHEPHKIVQLRQKYKELYADDLLKDIKSETTGNYRLALTRLIGGPHEAEAQWLNKSDSSFFMDDKLVAEALFGKSSVDIKLIMFHFEQATGVPLQKALEDLYLSHSYTTTSYNQDATGTTGAFGRACIRALKADREVETVEGLTAMNSDRALERDSRIMLDIEDLYKTERGTGGPKYLNQTLLLELIMTKSDLYLAELCRRFYERHGKQLTELAVAKDRSKMLVHSTFPVNLGYAVAYALNGAVNKPQRDAKLLEDCVKGLGTQDNRLIARILRIHYDPDPRHLFYVKEVYHQKYGKNLIDRIRSNTKGAYRGLLVKLLEGRQQMVAESFF